VKEEEEKADDSATKAEGDDAPASDAPKAE
jgi:hypothetical protein